jgi:hypothetical protein
MSAEVPTKYDKHALTDEGEDDDVTDEGNG